MQFLGILELQYNLNVEYGKGVYTDLWDVFRKCIGISYFIVEYNNGAIFNCSGKVVFMGDIIRIFYYFQDSTR